LKITLVASLALLTTDALFAQSADQGGVDALQSQMNRMQKQYEQRIEVMEAKALEANAVTLHEFSGNGGQIESGNGEKVSERKLRISESRWARSEKRRSLKKAGCF
jgi:hypothetical protein